MKSEIEHRLIIEIAKGLKTVEVRNGCFVSLASLQWVKGIEEWLPEETTRKCQRFCGGSGLKTLISNELQRRLRSYYSYDNKAKPTLLPAIARIDDAMTLAQKIVDVVKGLPYRYQVTVGLPLTFSTPLATTITRTELNKATTILAASELPSPFHTTTDEPGIGATIYGDWFDEDEYETTVNDERLYIATKQLGYSGSGGASIMARELEDTLRALYGACLALKVFAYGSEREPKELPILIHRDDAPDRPLVATEAVESDLWDNRDRFSTSRSMDAGKLLEALEKVKTIFVGDVFSNRLFTAAIWFFRAKHSSRPLDKLLEATIAIEVMLGDKETADGVGLTKLLGNRCAYMLGKTNDERDAIQKTFTRLYKLRSDIVHIGKHRANQEEAATVDEAVDLCGRIIAHEIGALHRHRKAA